MKRATGLLLSCLCFAFIAIADLHDTDNSADYLIISSSDIIMRYNWIQDLADWRNEHGRVSMIVSTEEIFNEFGDGSPSDTTLKEFLHYARLNWTPPHLQDVFFIGHHDVVPSHVKLDSVSSRPIDYLSDFFYMTEIETEDFLPVLSIGRLPWSPQWEIPFPDYFSKIVAYESAPEADWQRQVHLITDAPDALFDFVEIANDIVENIPENFDIERDYWGISDADPFYANHDTILQNLNRGSFTLTYIGHGGPPIWSSQEILDSTISNSLNNQPRFPIVNTLVLTGFSLSQELLETGDIAYSMLTNPIGGAIAYFANSNVTWAGAGTNYATSLIEAETDASITTLGMIHKNALTDFIAQYPTFPNPVSVRQTAYGSVLFGDPALRLPDRSTAANENPNPELPKSIALLGNYPNPFNSITTIKYTVPSAARISLTIYNVEGREVETLVDDLVNAGEHSVNWNASAQASGIYFAMLRSGSVTKTAKLVYLK